MDLNFDTLVLSGGGAKIISTLGALQYYWEKNKLRDIKTYIGSSSGSFVSLLLSCGYTPMQLLSEILKVDVIMDTGISLKSMFTEFGLLDIDNLVNHVVVLIRKIFDITPTLKELHELTGKEVIIVVTNVNSGEPEYLNYENEPDLSCFDAIRMSCSLPFIFKAIPYKNSLYIDGGAVDNFPISHVDDGNHVILGIRTILRGPFTPKSLWDYIMRVIYIPVSELQRRSLNNVSDKCHIIDLDVESIPITEFIIDRDKKMNMFINGYNFTKKEEDWGEWD